MKTLRLGHSLDKCIDMGPLVQLSHWKDVSHHVQTARDEGAEVYQACNGAANPPNLPEGRGPLDPGGRQRPKGKRKAWITKEKMGKNTTIQILISQVPDSSFNHCSSKYLATFFLPYQSFIALLVGDRIVTTSSFFKPFFLTNSSYFFNNWFLFIVPSCSSASLLLK